MGTDTPNPLHPPEDRRCEASTQAGTRCNNWITGLRYCERHRNLEKYNGGPGKAASVVADEDKPRDVLAELGAMPLETRGDARAALNAARSAMVRGVLSAKQHATFVTSVQTIIRDCGLREDEREPSRDRSADATKTLEELAAARAEY